MPNCLAFLRFFPVPIARSISLQSLTVTLVIRNIATLNHFTKWYNQQTKQRSTLCNFTFDFPISKSFSPAFFIIFVQLLTEGSTRLIILKAMKRYLERGKTTRIIKKCVRWSLLDTLQNNPDSLLIHVTGTD